MAKPIPAHIKEGRRLYCKRAEEEDDDHPTPIPHPDGDGIHSPLLGRRS